MKEMPTLSLASSEKFLKHAFDLQQNKCLKQPIFNLTPKCEKKKKIDTMAETWLSNKDKQILPP